MGILKETIQGTKIINEIKSSNIKKSEYDTETKKWLLNSITDSNMNMKTYLTKFTQNLEWLNHKVSFSQQIFQKHSSTKNYSIYINE